MVLGRLQFYMSEVTLHISRILHRKVWLRVSISHALRFCGLISHALRFVFLSLMRCVFVLSSHSIRDGITCVGCAVCCVLCAVW